MITMDHEHWLNSINIETQDEKDDLIESIVNVCDTCSFNTKREGSKLFVKGWIGEILLLPSEKAKADFLKQVEQVDVPDDPEEGFHRNMGDLHA